MIISRPGYSPEKIEEVVRHNFAGYAYDPSHETWTSPHSKGSFILQHMEPVPISSTEIREKMRKGLDIKDLVLPEVENYIIQQGLYI